MEIRAKYDGEIAYVDNRIGQVLDLMGTLRLDENTVVIITSDHGESFGIHNTMGHAGLHDTVIHVPLLISGPGVPKGKVVDALARQVDIVPTILDFAGIEFEESYPLTLSGNDNFNSPKVKYLRIDYRRNTDCEARRESKSSRRFALHAGVSRRKRGAILERGKPSARRRLDVPAQLTLFLVTGQAA